MSLLPIFVKLRDRLVVVVGGGAVAEGKIEGLFAAEARVRVVAPQVTPAIGQWIAQGKVEWRAKKFAPSDLEGAYLVIAATSEPGVNEAVFSEADAQGILCNAVDDIEHCHFYYGSVVQRGNLQIAISTNGRSPALAQRLRLQLEKQFGPEYELWLEWLGATRELLRAGDGGADSRKVLLHHLASQSMFDRFFSGGATTACEAGTGMGKVYLVGAGPGDPELLTVKAARLLARAGIVFHDSLVSREILDLIARDAEVIDVGKRCGQKLLTQDEINSLLVFAAANHDFVIRLKGGDPLIFGRAGEEIEALRSAGVDFEVVSGITAALGAAAAAGISLTDRRAASQVAITTFSRGTEGGTMDWGAVTSSTTLALYMPGPDYAEVAQRLREGGLPDDLPCVIVSNATGAEQQIRWTSVARLAQEEKLPAPALMIVGRVASRKVREISKAFWRGDSGNRDTPRTAVS